MDQVHSQPIKNIMVAYPIIEVVKEELSVLNIEDK